MSGEAEALRLESTDPAAVEAYARRLLDAYGLGDWSFGWNAARRLLGQCDHWRRRISLSRVFVARNGPAAVEDTIRHEVAHALCGPGTGHGPQWRAMCVRVGCRPERCGQAEMPAGRLVASCGGCGRSFRRHRRPRAGRLLWCRRCGRDRGKLDWKLVEGEGA